MANAAMKIGSLGFALWFVAVLGILSLNIFRDIFTDDFLVLASLGGMVIVALALLFAAIGCAGLYREHQSKVAMAAAVVGLFSFIGLIIMIIIPYVNISWMLQFASVLHFATAILIGTFLILLGIALIELEGAMNTLVVLPSAVIVIVAGVLSFIAPATATANFALVPTTLLCSIAFCKSK